MKKKILQSFLALALFTPCILSAQNSPEGRNSAGSSASGLSQATPVQEKHKISAAEFHLLPAEKQMHIRNNPHLYVIDNSIQVAPQRPVKHRISRSEFLNMPPDRQAYINANLDKYEIVD